MQEVINKQTEKIWKWQKKTYRKDVKTEKKTFRNHMEMQKKKH